MQIPHEEMPVTVRRLISLYNFKKYTRLVAGEKGLDRTVVHTTVWEAPDLARRLEGHEFVFSVGYASRTNPHLALEGFRELSDRVSAMGFKVGLYIDRIPEEYIRIANEKNLPLFEISHDCMFRWLIQSIMAEVNLYKASILLEVDQYFQELYSLSIRDGRDSVILTQLSERLQALCFILSSDLLSSTWPQPMPPETAQTALLGGVQELLRKHRGASEDIHEQDFHCYPITARGICLGYLILKMPGDLDEKAHLMARQLQMYLTMKWSERYADSQRFFTELWNDLLLHPEEEQKAIERRLKQCGLDPSGSFRVLTFSARKGMEELFRSRARFVAGSLAQHLSRKILVWHSQSECAVICESTGGKQLPNYLQKASELLSAEKSVLLAVGPAVQTAAQIRDSYRMAKNCVFASGRAENLDVSLLYCDDWLFELAQIAGAGSPEAALFTEKTLGPILRYDSDHGNRNFLETIRAVTAAEDLEQAAGRLHIHTNTLRYRIQRIREFTRLDLFLHRDRSKLSLALFYHEIGSQQWLIQNP